MRRFFTASILSVAVATGFQAKGATLDPNFAETVYATVGSQVTGMAWAPDGSNRLFISRKGGVIQIVKDGVVLPTPFATITPIVTTSECGLIGICFDPNFMVNGYLYVFVTVSSSEQQIIRYRAEGDVGTDKTTIIGGLPTRGANHDGGAVGVGPDGKLYWAVGDLGNGTGVDGDLTSLASKVGRANLDGTVPADNPFVDGPGGNNDYIWARGFRNPFTFNFQDSTGELWVNCVGTLYEQIFLVRKGDHAGWNDYENNQPPGFITPKIKYRTNGTDTRSLIPGSGAVREGGIVTFTTTAAHGFRQGERITVSGVADASFNDSLYVVSVPSPTTFTWAQAGPNGTSGGGSATTLHQGGCVTGGCFYDSSAVPAEYRGNYFYGDLNSGRVMRATLGQANEVTSVDYFVTGAAQHIDTSVGPDGALYYVTHPGIIYRLAYTNYATQQLVVTPGTLRMVEDGLAAFSVRLAQPPDTEVAVNVTHAGGDPAISVLSGESLSFNAGNWSVPQVVKVQAIVDGDATNGVAQLSVSSSGLASETVTVHAVDTVQPFAVGPVTASGPGVFPLSIGLSGQPGQTYVLEGIADLLLSDWTPISTNQLVGNSTNITDHGSTGLPSRYYRARLVD
jgi:glucose/arabinose dehydrogenase